MGPNVAIVGATGAVGAEFLEQLHKRKFPLGSLRLFASARSAGSKLRFGDQEITVEELTPEVFDGIDIALFSASSSVSKQYVDAVKASGAVMIDNSSAFRLDADVPLVIPEINPDAALSHKGVIANPNCTTIVTLMAVAPLHRAATLKRLIISSYQSISGAGAAAMNELGQQAKDWSAGNPLKVEAQAHQILFNLYPHIDVFMDNAYTKEEMKLVNEGRKILDHAPLRAAATCVRVPVMRCHSMSITAEFEKPLSPDDARRILQDAPGVELFDDPNKGEYPTPLRYERNDLVGVGRIREDISAEHGGLNLWAVGDQLAKGAAQNAVQIAELLVGAKT